MAHQLRMELFKDEASRDYVGTKPHLDQEDAACNTQAAFKPSQSTQTLAGTTSPQTLAGTTSGRLLLLRSGAAPGD